jgi:hypothetical protein
VTLGDNLATYLANSGIVVGFNFDWNTSGGIQGIWLTGGYTPYNLSISNKFSAANLAWNDSMNPLMEGVSELNVYYHMTLDPAPGAATVAMWNDGTTAIAYKGRAVGINAYIGDYSDNWSGDYAKIIVNAGNWLWLGTYPCKDALVCTDPNSFIGSIDTTDPVQTGRIFRASPGSTCASLKTCTVNDTDSYYYEPYYFWNNSSIEQCVTITLDPKTCVLPANMIQSAVYSGDYDPANICTNYLGDIGGSPTAGPKSYSIVVPAWTRYTIMVNSVSTGATCPEYRLQVSAAACPIQKITLPLVNK